ncbi:MAG: crosslink repair DNA glycosylase YcaQ family protein [Thermoleophilia bacterium]
MEPEAVLAFRFGRSGLAGRHASTLAAAAAAPAVDSARGSALQSLAARAEGVTRDAYDAAVDAGEVVVGYAMRGAIHAVAPDDHALWGRALVARRDDELAVQLGTRMRRLCDETGIAPTDALSEVTDATRDALAGGRALDKDALHAELRARVRDDLLPWCEGCGSHHVSPLLWRFATVAAGARLDAGRRYLLGSPGRAPAAAEALRRHLHLYGPGTPAAFAAWAGLAPAHARRLWDEVAADGALAEVTTTGGGSAWILAADGGALASPPTARGVRLLPPGDPYLQSPNRDLLAPAKDLRARLFRPTGSPGAVVQDGRLAGLWRATTTGRSTRLAVEPLRRLRTGDLREEAERVAALRGTPELRLDIA